MTWNPFDPMVTWSRVDLSAGDAAIRDSEKRWQASKEILKGPYGKPPVGPALEKWVSSRIEEVVQMRRFWRRYLRSRYGYTMRRANTPLLKRSPRLRLTRPEVVSSSAAFCDYFWWNQVFIEIAAACEMAVTRVSNGLRPAMEGISEGQTPTEAALSAAAAVILGHMQHEAEEVETLKLTMMAQLGPDADLLGTAATWRLSGYVSSNLNLNVGWRLGRALQQEATERGGSPKEALYQALPAVVFEQAIEKDALACHTRRLVTRVGEDIAAQLAQDAQLAPEADGLPPDARSLAGFELREAGLREFAQAEDQVLLEQLESRAGLSKREREVLALLLDGLPQTEIAVCLGIETGTVGSVASRVRRKLRAAIA